MKVLSNTSVYNYAELLGGAKLSAAIKSLIDDKHGAVYVTESQLEDVFYKIRHKSFNFKAKFGVIDLFRKGVIRLVYNEKVKLTVAVPFFAYKMQNGKLGVVVNISNYAHLEKDGSIKIDPLVLYSLMVAGAYSLQAETQQAILATNGLPEFYADLFVSVVARMSNLDMIRREKIKFIMTKFICMNLGMDEPRASSAAKKVIKNLDDYSVEQLDLAIPVAAYVDLDHLINALREALPEISGITYGMIFDRWIKSYGEATGFALEYIPFFILTFVALITNCNSLANVKTIEREANKDARRLVTLYDRIETAVQVSANI